MKIEILGVGCPKCRTLYENVKIALAEKGIEAEVIKVEDIAKITEYGVLSTPAMVVDGEVKTTGRIPSVEEIEKIIS